MSMIALNTEKIIKKLNPAMFIETVLATSQSQASAQLKISDDHGELLSGTFSFSEANDVSFIFTTPFVIHKANASVAFERAENSINITKTLTSDEVIQAFKKDGMDALNSSNNLIVKAESTLSKTFSLIDTQKLSDLFTIIQNKTVHQGAMFNFQFKTIKSDGSVSLTNVVAKKSKRLMFYVDSTLTSKADLEKMLVGAWLSKKLFDN